MMAVTSTQTAQQQKPKFLKMQQIYVNERLKWRHEGIPKQTNKKTKEQRDRLSNEKDHVRSPRPWLTREKNEQIIIPSRAVKEGAGMEPEFIFVGAAKRHF